MVGLINLMPLILATVGLIWIYRGWKKGGDFVIDVVLRVVATVGIILLYQHFQPSYLPKGEINRTEVVQEEVVNEPIADKLLKPMPAEERDARRKEQYKEKIEFINQKEVDNK